MRLQRARIGGRRVRNFSSRGLCFEFWRVNDDYFELLVFIAVHSERGNWGQLRLLLFLLAPLSWGDRSVHLLEEKAEEVSGTVSSMESSPDWSR
jgi:hypothetical protein